MHASALSESIYSERKSNEMHVTFPSCFIFVPAYNAEQTIARVLDRIPQPVWQMATSVCIINDGSTDKTLDALSQTRKKYRKLKVHSFQQNSGYGSAVIAGLTLARASAADYAICVHADGQYPPEEIPALISHMHEQSLDILQGSRHKDGTALEGGMPLYKFVAGKALVWLENRVFGLDLTDYHSGFLFYSRRALNAIPFHRLSSSFDFDLEMIASAQQCGLRIGELGIPTHYGDEKSYLNPIAYGLRVLRVLFKYKTGQYK